MRSKAAHRGSRVAFSASVKDIDGRRRRSRLLASTAILLTALAAPPAFANDECGTGTFVVCTSAANPYSSGITYDPITDLTLVVEGDVVITPGAGTEGIRVDSTGGTVDVTIEDGAYIAASAAHGIVLSGAGETRLHMGGTMIVGYEAIKIVDAAGGVAVTLGGSIAATNGAGEGAYVRNTAGNVEIDVLGNNTIATTGLSSHGIFVDGAHNVSIDLAAGNMIEAEYGVGVAINGASDVAIQSHGTIEAGFGIFVSDSSGDVEILSSGPIEIHNAYSEDGAGIRTRSNDGRVRIESASTITTQGSNAFGISVAAATEQEIAVINSGVIATSGPSSHGIFVIGYSTGLGIPVAIDTSSASTIVTSGAGSHGISVINHGLGVGNVAIDAAGSIEAQGQNSDGIYIKNALGTVDIEISGGITGGSGTGAAIRIIGDSDVTLSSSGTINGTVITGDGNDRFTNAGTLRGSYADFGGGSDSFLNDGTFELAGSVNGILGLESFTNRGTIDLADGASGDTLSISGDFTSRGGALYIDTDLDAGTADLLTLAAVAATSNPTRIHVTETGNGGTASAPILIADTQIDRSAGAAFSLATPLIDGLEYELCYLASETAWYLQPVGMSECTAVTFNFDYPALVSGALLSFASDLQALHQRLRNAASSASIEPAAWHGAVEPLGPWLQLSATRQQIDGSIAYDQGIEKLALGFDSELASLPAGRFIFGGFAGFGRTEQHFQAADASSDILLAGAHGRYALGPFYAHGIIKYEHHDAQFADGVAPEDAASFALDLLGGSAEAGYRVDSDVVSIAPRIRLSYLRAWGESFEDASGSVIDLKTGESLSGELALALTAWDHVHIEGGLRHEFLGEQQAEVSGLILSNALPGTVGFLAPSLILPLLRDDLHLGLSGEWAKGDGMEELSASTFLRLRL